MSPEEEKEMHSLLRIVPELERGLYEMLYRAAFLAGKVSAFTATQNLAIDFDKRTTGNPGEPATGSPDSVEAEG